MSQEIKKELQDAIDGISSGATTDAKPSDGSGQIMLTSNGDIRNEDGQKLEMMEVVELINSRKYNMEVFTDAKGNKFIQIKKIK
ncbi:MAG: hypothetical protein H6567_06610 [Lewinellaceae bacterium]|nr:hypothetical protein [Lewinellaceae bacterium]